MISDEEQRAIGFSFLAFTFGYILLDILAKEGFIINLLLKSFL